ncbi:MAG: sugar ABC transporter permease [Candidatus Hydrogenedentes bacterium]|nr:sugar ABC transporter permease [Candidatus Hydrogenedentota bacterium]
MASIDSRGNVPNLLRRIAAHRHFYLFISPYFILFAILGLYPLVFSFVLSFARWDGLTELRWVGFSNFVNLFGDEVLLDAIWNTVILGLMYVPPMLAGAFFLALLLNTSWLHCRAWFRAAVFLPVITPMVVVAVVFGLLYDFEHGILNYGLQKLGLPAIPWLLSEHWSKPSLALVLIWRWTGYNMVLMLAGLQSISKEYYEAAVLDGAGPFQRMRHVTLPLMRPVFVFCTIMSIIGTVYLFDEIFVLTSGGPGTSSMNIGLYLFNLSFSDFRFGYASTLAYVTAFIVFLASLFVLRFQRQEGD